MRFSFVELPVFVNHDTYTSEINSMAEQLLDTGIVHSIFQVGGISDPGISDIDLLVIFHDNAKFNENPVHGLRYPGKYLFTHRLFGTGKFIGTQIEKFTFFNNYKHICGEKIDMKSNIPSQEEISILKPQIALEYLIKAYLAIQIGIEYRIIKVRSFLLHAKAIKYDFDFLSLNETRFHEVIDSIIKLRSDWFNNRVNNSQLEELVISYRNILKESIEIALNKYQFYLPINSPYSLSRNIRLNSSNEFSLERNGFLPMYLLSLGLPAVIKLLNRINSFDLNVPFQNNLIPDIIQSRHKFMVDSFQYNKRYLPNFICTGHGLNVFQN